MKAPVRPLFNPYIVTPYKKGGFQYPGLSRQEDGAKEEKKMKKLRLHPFDYRLFNFINYGYCPLVSEYL
jgi:hypothetical protein